METQFLYFAFLLSLLLSISPSQAQAQTQKYQIYTPSVSRDYAGVRNFLDQIARNHPHVTQVRIGNSDGGQEIQAVQIGNGPIHNIVVATHHGNEYGSTEVALGFIEDLAQNPIADQTIHVIPVLNTSGYDRRSRMELDTRNTARDPNRDYPGPCGSGGPFLLRSTHALDNYINLFPIVNSATLHTHFPAVVYPWGLSTRDLQTPYDTLYIQLAQVAAQLSGYRVGNSTEVLYPADGTYEDYVFHQYGIWSLLFEMGNSHSPRLRDIPQMVEQNSQGMRAFFEQAPTQRAERHAFSGNCDRALMALDLKNE